MFTATRQTLNQERDNSKTERFAPFLYPLAPLQHPGSALVLKIAHVPNMRPWSLLSEGREQTLFSKNSFVYFDLSGGYLKDIGYMTLLHLNQNSFRQKSGYIKSIPEK